MENSEIQGTERVGYGRPPISSRFKKGQTGNPLGNHKHTRHHKALIYKLLRDKTILEDGDEIMELTHEEAMILGQIRGAEAGNSKCYNALLDRFFGKVPTRTEFDDGKGNKQFASEDEHREFNRQRLIALERKAIESADATLEKAENILQSETKESKPI